jgi:hypothetical protein
MEDLSGLTPTQLLKISNDIVAQHETLKNEIISLTYESDELNKKINEKLVILDMLEKNYVIIAEEINKR